ncbi:MAG: hypothetical protein H8D23_27705 [Candidatus Brocadiales bacterium]|nr:hypothetical protein [Candidatus Brocadiales bacterium]
MRYKGYELMPVSYQEEGSNEWRAKINILRIDAGINQDINYPFTIETETFKTEEEANGIIILLGKQKIDNDELGT